MEYEMILFQLIPNKESSSYLSVLPASVNGMFGLTVKNTSVNTLFTYSGVSVNGSFPENQQSAIYQADVGGFLYRDSKVDSYKASAAYVSTIIDPQHVQQFKLEKQSNGLYFVSTLQNNLKQFLSYNPIENKIYFSSDTKWEQHSWTLNEVYSK
jgi:hypothetical protein